MLMFRRVNALVGKFTLVSLLLLAVPGLAYPKPAGKWTARVSFNLKAGSLVPSRAAAPLDVTVEKIEVIQVIQDIQNSVPLVAGKATLVRAYLSYEADSPITVTGTLTLKKVGGGPATEIASDKPLRIDPSLNGQTATKRKDINNSLNFLLPAVNVPAGQFTLTLSIKNNSTGALVVCPSCSQNPAQTAEFISVPPLRVRLIGMRYNKRDFTTGLIESVAPTDEDFNMVESWIRRAYPISQLISTRSIIPVPSQTWRPTNDQACNYINALLSIIRKSDINGNSVDPRTRYYGLVADGGGFMRGCADVLSSTPGPDSPASGPTGQSAFDWDRDGVYGDWYTGHELAHTFGRKHPGKCGETPDDSVPQTQFIGDVNEVYIGYDAGDDKLPPPLPPIRPSILTGPPFTDLMTYCENQWVSAYTYREILSRLLAEGQLNPAVVTGTASSGPPAATEPPPSSAGPMPSPSNSGPVPSVVGLAPASSSSSLLVQSASPARNSSGEVSGGARGSNLESLPATPQERNERGKLLAIVATINITKKTGELLPPLPVSQTDNTASGRDVQTYPLVHIRIKNKVGENIGEYIFPIHLTTDRRKDEDVTGMINGTIPYMAQTATIELILAEGEESAAQTVLQTFKVDEEQPKVKNLSVKPQMSGPGQTSPFPLDISWEASDKGGNKITYNIEMSTDGGKTWTTVAAFYENTAISLDPKLDPSENVSEIQIRVRANDGFNTSATVKTFKVK
jgi:hypothetical protein